MDYEILPGKKSDLEDMSRADTAWVSIASDTPLLVIAEPTEVYLDPARNALSQDPDIRKWVEQITELNGLGPWRPFFECRVLLKDESMVSSEEVEKIRQRSRQLFASTESGVVTASLEFRRLLTASGYGAHPSRTAKNYPNFESIRDRIGYKNILYTNMITAGLQSEILPALEAVFGRDITANLDINQLVRGSALRVVAHEENHPFRRFRDVPLEELKATVNGIAAVSGSAFFSEDDIRSLLLTELGAALFTRNRMQQAKLQGDTNTQRGLGAYFIADTMFINYLFDHQGFLTDEKGNITGLNYPVMHKVINLFTEELAAVQKGDTAQTIPQFYEQYEKEEIWERLKVKDS